MSQSGASATRTGRRETPAIIRFIDWLSGAFAVLAALGLGLLAVNVMADVIGRTLFHQPWPGTLEMTAYWWMPILTLLAFALTEKHNEHIKVTIMLDTLPPRMRQIVEGVFGIVATGLIVALAYYTLRDALGAAALRKTTPSTPPVAMWPFVFVALAGVTMLALQTAANTYRLLAGLPPAAAPDDPEDSL